MSSMKKQLYTMVVMLSAVQLVKKLDAEDPRVLWGARIAYLAFTAISLAIQFLISRSITARNEETVIHVPPKAQFGTDPSKLAKTPMPIRDYEMGLVHESVKSQLLNVAIIGFIHVKMGSIFPLLLGPLNGIMRLVDNPQVKVHLRGFEAKGALKRPYPAPDSPFKEMKKQMEEVQKNMDPASATSGDASRRARRRKA